MTPSLRAGPLHFSHDQQTTPKNFQMSRAFGILDIDEVYGMSSGMMISDCLK